MKMALEDDTQYAIEWNDKNWDATPQRRQNSPTPFPFENTRSVFIELRWHLDSNLTVKEGGKRMKVEGRAHGKNFLRSAFNFHFNTNSARQRGIWIFIRYNFV